MPFRQKAKNIFKSSRTRNGSSSTSSSSTNHDVYKPGEAMPPPKYRRAPAKEHTEHLESFSFADAWRKRSFQSSHSPMGTAPPSRRHSVVSVRGLKGWKSVAAAGDDTDHSDVGAGAERLPAEPEVDGDDDVANVGLSRVQSKDRPANGYVLHKTLSTAHDHQPFSEQDISAALHRSRVQVSAH